ncbi:hypothetical protein CERSUDRAFT_74617 [Gelatoporia subvermispora B]|uniref:Uncharacterized protein n=1 Tax=Ceriporiopsis subvermispora (strain B) TaxID=914234 RepID=M2RAG5_CERS8|nr:hypothetical protein CERSUDRAFT_74617 [Gelatoporia subvermispora B]
MSLVCPLPVLRFINAVDTPILDLNTTYHKCDQPDGYQLSASRSGEGKTKLNLAAIMTKSELEGTNVDDLWVASTTKEDALRRFSHSVQNLKEILQIDTKCPRIPKPSKAHVMSPYQGAGGGRTIEDGYIVATIIAHPSITRETLPHALRRDTSAVQPGRPERSHEAGLLNPLDAGGLEKVTVEESCTGAVSAEALEATVRREGQLADWAETTSLGPDVERARRLVDERLHPLA